MDFAELIDKFGAQLGVEGLKLDGDGICRIDVDGMVIAFREIPEGNEVITWAEVGEPPPEGRERLYQVLLESMFMGQGTAGCLFSYERDSGKLFLHRTDSLVLLDDRRFVQNLESFVNLLDMWRRLIADFRPGAEDAGVSPQEESGLSNVFAPDGFLQV